ncbi:MAG: DUF5615 family PIN-like protein [Gemmatimonadota bacterium]|nr:DUF5615 family PIN-like protein [Gemmatimonadota bacterium]
MRILADENVPAASVSLLKNAGHDVLAVAEEMRGADDREVVGRAIGEDRIVLTFDRDFGRLILEESRSRSPAGLILMRFVPRSPVEPGEVLLGLIARRDIEFRGRVSVMERSRVRQRRLPTDR